MTRQLVYSELRARQRDRNLFVYQSRDERDLLAKCEALALLRESGLWLFRGQGNSAWGVSPSLFRPDSNIKEPAEFERYAIHAMRRLVEQTTTLPQRLLEDDNVLLAMAQHYGLRTSLLDWTRDPDVALYFAVSDALRLQPQTGKCSVFAMADGFLRHHPHAHLVSTPRAANPNLAAQRGVLTKHYLGIHELWTHAQEKRTQDPAANA